MVDRSKAILGATKRGPEGNFDTFIDPEAELLYVDGFGTMSVGLSVTRVEAFKIRAVIAKEDGSFVEEREVDRVIVMPTIAMFDFIAVMFENAINNSPVMAKGVTDMLDRLQAVKNRVRKS